MNSKLKQDTEDAIALIEDDEYWKSLNEKVTYEEFLEWIKPTNFNGEEIDIEDVEWIPYNGVPI